MDKPDSTGKKLGELLEQKRVEKFLSYRVLTSRLSLKSVSTVYGWINGKFRPSSEHIPTIAHFLGIGEDEVVEMIRRETGLNPRSNQTADDIAPPSQVGPSEFSAARVSEIFYQLAELAGELGDHFALLKK